MKPGKPFIEEVWLKIANAAHEQIADQIPAEQYEQVWHLLEAPTSTRTRSLSVLLNEQLRPPTLPNDLPSSQSAL